MNSCGFSVPVSVMATSTVSVDGVVRARTDTGTLKPHEFIGVLFHLSAEDVKVMRLTKTATQFHPDPSAQEEYEEGHEEYNKKYKQNKNELEQLPTTG